MSKDAAADAGRERYNALSNDELSMLVDGRLEQLRSGIELMAEARAIYSWEAHAEGAAEYFAAIKELDTLLHMLEKRHREEERAEEQRDDG